MNRMIKIKIRKILPYFIFSSIEFFIKFFVSLKYNFNDTVFLMSAIKSKSLQKDRYMILLLTHGIEKGLTHKELRLGFGLANLTDIAMKLKAWNAKKNPKTDFSYQYAVSTIKSYFDLHELKQFDTSHIKQLFDVEVFNDIVNFDNLHIHGGSKIKNISDLDFNGNFTSIASQRFSFREYDKTINMDIGKIKEAIQVAQHSPSSCNRQTVRAYLTIIPDKIKIMIKIQGGVDQIPPGLITVTADVAAYPNAKTRSLPFVDAGLFSMSLCYALHERKIATLILNATLTRTTEKKIMRLIGTASSEKVVLFIAIGNMKDKMTICESLRVPLDYIYRIID